MRNNHILLSDIIEAFEAWADGAPEPTVDVGGRTLPIGRAAGVLWRCRDHMPNSLRQDLLGLIRHGDKQHTEISLCRYSQAARILKQRIGEALIA